VQPAKNSPAMSLLPTYPTEGMICWPVSARVGNVKNNDPTLIEPLAAE
jgi:putative SOS response-associated peptidase YedK